MFTWPAQFQYVIMKSALSMRNIKPVLSFKLVTAGILSLDSQDTKSVSKLNENRSHFGQTLTL